MDIPKPDGKGTRSLGIPTVWDRFIQQAILPVLTPLFDPHFSESSYGFRPGRGCHDAVQAAQAYVEAGYRYVVDIDLEKFFDRVNHDVLMSRVARRLKNKVLLRGWVAYFRLAQVKNVFEDLDQWIRRRLRLILWRQWKKPRTRVKKLIRLGMERERAWLSS